MIFNCLRRNDGFGAQLKNEELFYDEHESTGCSETSSSSSSIWISPIKPEKKLSAFKFSSFKKGSNLNTGKNYNRTSRIPAYSPVPRMSVSYDPRLKAVRVPGVDKKLAHSKKHCTKNNSSILDASSAKKQTFFTKESFELTGANEDRTKKITTNSFKQNYAEIDTSDADELTPNASGQNNSSNVHVCQVETFNNCFIGPPDNVFSKSRKIPTLVSNDVDSQVVPQPLDLLATDVHVNTIEQSPEIHRASLVNTSGKSINNIDPVSPLFHHTRSELKNEQLEWQPTVTKRLNEIPSKQSEEFPQRHDAGTEKFPAKDKKKLPPEQMDEMKQRYPTQTGQLHSPLYRRQCAGVRRRLCALYKGRSRLSTHRGNSSHPSITGAGHRFYEWCGGDPATCKCPLWSLPENTRLMLNSKPNARAYKPKDIVDDQLRFVKGLEPGRKMNKFSGRKKKTARLRRTVLQRDGVGIESKTQVLSKSSKEAWRYLYFPTGTELYSLHRESQRTLHLAAENARKTLAQLDHNCQIENDSKILPFEDIQSFQENPVRQLVINRSPGQALGFTIEGVCMQCSDNKTEYVYTAEEVSPYGLAGIAGLRDGDDILRINNSPLYNLSEAEVMDALKQNENVVTLVICVDATNDICF